MKASFAGTLLVAWLVAGPPDQKLLDLMAQGKTETDLGHYDDATRSLSTIAEAADAPPALRAEALVRLGVARRGAGDREGALQAFDRASKASGLDGQGKALLVQAVGGALPGEDRWAEIWRRVSFRADRSEPARPTLAVVWPDVQPAKTYKGQPVTLDLKDGDLHDVFRLIADISGLNVVVNPGVRGHVTFKVVQQPWDLFLDRILAPNGLTYLWEDNVLRIARPQHLPPPRHYSGQRIDLWWGKGDGPQGRDLREGLAELAASGGATVVIDPAVQGNVVLKLNQVRWDHAFDIIVRVNGLDWTQDGKTLRVFPPPKAVRP